MASKTTEEIQALKDNWFKDPCWNIEKTDGFEDYYDELLAFRLELEKKLDEREEERKAKRHEEVFRETDVSDPDVTESLSTFKEIEQAIAGQEQYIGEFPTHKEIVDAELMSAQVRSNLLIAAQLKRIADILNEMDDHNGLAESVRIWGS